jgi:hypothetical protein
VSVRPRQFARALRLLPALPGLARAGRAYRRARRRGPVVIVFLPLWGQWPYLAPLVRGLVAEGRELFFSVDFLHPTRPAERLQELGFTAERIFPHQFAPLFTGSAVFLSATQWVDHWPRGAAHRVCIFHGLPTKGNTFLPERIARFTDLFLIGPTHRDLYQRSYGQSHPDAAIRLHEVGYPKLDELLGGGYDPGPFHARLGLPPGPAVLYAPAYDPGTSLREYGTELIEALLELPATVLVKLHPALLAGAADAFDTGGVDWPAVMERFSGRANFRHVTEPDITPCLAAAEVMVTDVSGAALEFMMQGKPVVFIDCPRFFDEHLPRAFGVDGRAAREDPAMNAGRHLGTVVRDLPEMKAQVRRLLAGGSGPGVRPEELLYHPGHASAVALALLREFLL